MVEKRTHHLEKELQMQWTRIMKQRGALVHKLSDFSLGSKPCDAFGVLDGITWYHELKTIAENQRLQLAVIRDCQVAALFKIEKNRNGNPHIVAGVVIGIGMTPHWRFLSAVRLKELLDEGEKGISAADLLALPLPFPLDRR